MTIGMGEFTTASCSSCSWASRCRSGFAAACVLALSSSLLTTAWAQTAQQSASVPAPAAAQPAPQQSQQGGVFPAQPAPAERPGFIYAFGRWWDSARGKFEDLGKHSSDAGKEAASATQDAMRDAADATKGAANATQDALKNAAEATKDAASTLFKLPGIRVVEVHQRCITAPNGAPDCRTAAVTACRAKGFNAGRPVDVRTSENCPPAVWMSGGRPGAGECPEETVVLMAACQ